ncbi:ATP-binding cassette sub-family A member 7-like protein [Leptotrombidium deliense]|uniref:ATP-binding cassette sub-family A member 7-like protein n=1 Tax=Leptotrombidium deliense TaxID=299467 RepID=A0A443SM15_9ACAR|nr:ATP-binding cassette sub-family A member 7-like protein [Leptotrombidium deliense]
MSVKTQLKLLLWKNFTSHRRQKLRVLIEITWPLLLMLILMWVRSRGLKVEIHECHFDEKALPSAGLMPFLRSTICSFNNTCNVQITDGATIVRRDERNVSTFETLLEKLEKVLNTNLDSRTLKRIQNVNSDLELLSNFVKKITNPDTQLKGFNETNYEQVSQALNRTCDKLVDNYSELVTNVADYIDFTKVIAELTKVVNVISGQSIHDEDWSVVLQLFSNITSELSMIDNQSQITQDLIEKFALIKRAIDDPMNNTIRLIQTFLCGRNISKFYDRFSRGATQKFEEFEEEMKQHFITQREDDSTTYIYDNTTTPKCNAFFKSLERGHITRVLWKQMKPFVRGKIIFTPDSPVVRRVLQNIRKLFEPISTSMQLIEYWFSSVSPKVKYFIENSLPLFDSIRQLTSPENIKIVAELLNKRNNGTSDMTPTLEMWNNVSMIVSGDALDLLNKTNSILQELYDHLQCFEVEKFEGFKDEREIITKGLDLIAENKLWAALVFENLHANHDKLPPYVKYKIRMDASKIDSTKKIEDRISRPGPRRRPAIDLKYITFGFAYIQDLVEHSIIREQVGKDVEVGMYLQQFPSPCFIYDQFIMAISRSFPLFMVLSWVYTSSMITKSIVHEKEKRLKEFMKVMGLSNGVLWLSWFIDSFIFMFTSCVLLDFILIGGNILQHSDASLVFVFLIVYCVTVIFQSFMLSTLFSKANMAAAAGGIIFFMTYLPYPFLVLWEEKLTGYEKMLSCLIPNVAFGFGCSYLAHFEEHGTGVQWSNLFESPIPGDEFCLGYVMLMFLKDTFIFWLLTWYIEAVFPGEYGVPKPWYFFVTKKYWCSIPDKISNGSDEDVQRSMLNGCDADFEEEPKDLNLGIAIRRLTKVYKGCKVAVSNLTLNFYEGQITSFLGHNGAGKTTTISILTGLLTPTSGTAKIYGKDIRTDMDNIRKSLGTCPQHNVLFNNLTVYEHLWFYALLKGAKETDVAPEANQMIEDMGLIHKRHEISRNLSGGMQRKLSIGIAFIGGSQTVILDEPTSGVDPYSRRSIWELLLKYKSNRTVILTTHHMDEADLLGDRIAVIAHGKLRCCGSSLFLKSHFGSGYYLTLVKEHDKTSQASSSSSQAMSCLRLTGETGSRVDDEGLADMLRDGTNGYITWKGDCTTSKITEFIHTYVPESNLVQKVGFELTYLVPLSAQASGALQQLLDALEKNLYLLDVSSYGISDTPLEEVFLSVTGAVEEEEKAIQDSINNAVETITEGGRYPSRLRLNSVACNNLIKNILPFRQKMVANSLKQANAVTPAQTANDDEKTCEDETIEMKDMNSVPLTSSTGQRYSFVNGSKNRVTGWRLTKQQFMALETKRFNHTRRNSRGLFCEIVLPAFFICFSMVFTLILPPVVEEPPLELSPWLYGPPNYIFYTENSQEVKPNTASDIYINELLSRYGIGAKCIDGVKKPKQQKYFHSRLSWSDECSAKPINKTYLSPKYNISEIQKVVECSCGSGAMKCPAGAEGPEPPSVTLSTGDVLYNTSGRNVSDWILKSYSKYYKKRYGGFSFNYQNSMSNSVNSVNATKLFNVLQLLLNISDIDLGTEIVKNFSHQVTKNTEGMNSLYNIKVWFNNKGWASSVSYMNAINNVILRAHLPSEVKQYYGISVVNHPMNFTQEQLKDELLKRGGLSLLHSVCVLFAMSFVPASFVLYLIEDRVTGSKHLQYVSGVSPYVYWTAAYIWDICNYLVPTFLCVIIFVAFNAEAYVSKDNLWAFILLLLLYGFASVPLMYPTSYLFQVPSSAFVILACINLFIGIVTTIATFVLELFDDEDLQYTGSLLKKVFLIFPHFCLGRGLMEMSTNHLASQMFAQFGFVVYRSPFDWNYLGKNITCMIIQGIVAFAFVLLIESSFIFKFKDPKTVKYDQEKEDDDVVKERQRVLATESSECPLLVKNLTKVYKRNHMPAVDNLCMAVEGGECFGLLGVNGAGKTTTFKMLTGDVNITEGDAFVTSHSIQTQLNEARQNIGYCPQFDALNSLLTGREHLEFYARLRGMPESEVKKAVAWSIRKLELVEYADFCAGTYSGGNKRKLSTAIALMGNPSVVFLDEPTTGMDPKARRFLWNCVLDVVRDGCAVILTSHSMEECEALCTRLAIMVNGKFRCLGSIQHLKSKYGEGYTVTIRVNGGTEELECTKSFVEEVFNSNATLKEVHLNQIEYQINSKVGLAFIFSEMEKAKSRLNIADYSVSQTTLDQVFIRFARLQSDLAKNGVENV